MVKVLDAQQYEIIVQYDREGCIWHDRYYYVRVTQREAIEDIKRDWHKDNDHLFPGAFRAKFFAECI